jgi:glycosyltransferase involved in cell wall biosynthesis
MKKVSQKMPKLLSLNSYNYRRGGSDVVFLEQDAMFRTQGWDTAVMTMHHPKNEPSPWARFFADEIEFGHEYGILDKLTMAGKVIYSGEARNKISALLDDFPADVAHAHCIYHHLSPSVLVELKQRGIPTVMTAHDLKLACPAYKMLNRGGVCEKCRNGNLLHVVTNRCIRDSLAVSALIMLESSVHKSLGLYRRNLDRVVVPSLFYKQKLMEWGWPEQQLAYIPNYVDAAAYTPSYKPGDYFFFFGRLAMEKGVATLIHAAAQAKVKLCIAGTGPESDALKALAQEVGGDIEFLGFVSGDPLWKLVTEARAIVLPSEWYENAPMSVLEAYASGKPVIGARIGGIPEMVHEDKTGALFESGSVDELAAVLVRFANMPDEQISTMGEEARTYVSTTFTARRYMQQTLALYTELGVNVNAQQAFSQPNSLGVHT